MTRQQLEKIKTSSTPKPTPKPTSKSRKRAPTTATRPQNHIPTPVLKSRKPAPILYQIFMYN